MRSKIAKHIWELRKVETEYLKIKEKNRAIRSHAKQYANCLRMLGAI